MEQQILKIFDINTDAVATNRGFYYQYLTVLKKWIQNFVNEKDIETYTEVDDDIKEVGEDLIFTQVKCYASSFSFNSTEIKDSIFNFFLLFLKYNNLNENIKFCFSTNTKIAPREKLLTRWFDDLQLNDSQLQVLCTNKIKEVLINEINIRKNKKLQKNISTLEKNEVKTACESFKKYIKTSNLEIFVKSIVWEFNHISPEESIILIKSEIDLLLSHTKFNNKSKTLIFSVLISEIYKKSQNTEKNKRCLNNQDIFNILNQTDIELEKIRDNKFTRLLSIEVELIKTKIDNLEFTQEFQGAEIVKLKSNIKSLGNKPIPKYLTLLPDVISNIVLDWDTFLIDVKTSLEEKKIVSIYAEGGMGKTSFAKKYLKAYNQYNHIIWINVENSISYAFSFDEILLNNLNIEFSENDDNEHKFKLIINEINKIEGNNLLIVDIQNANDEIESLKLIASLTNWEKLILTRSHLKNITSFKLPKISFEFAKKIYITSCAKEEIDDELFKDFFDFIDYNVLVIELTAKTIENSIDLSLNSFLNSLKEQKLDDVEFNIDIDITEENSSIRIFQFLLKKFSFNNLENLEKTYLDYLALLPSTNIYIEDVILINGADNYNKNKITIGNIINSLEKKGLIEYSSDRKRINIHKIIREVIIYNAREKSNPFFNCVFYIIWLTARLKEAQNNPSKSYKFLRYAESILISIKEEYRKSINQPLLILENELLYLYRYYFNTDVENSKWINLVERAEKYLESNDVNLGVIYNNLAISEEYNDENEKAIIYFKKALIIFRKEEFKYIDLIITISNNISNVYLKNKDLVNALNFFKKVQEIRTKYSYFDGQQLSIVYRILAESYKITGDFDKAIELITDGISLHKSLETSKRNDFYLAAYYNQLSNLYLLKQNYKLAVANQEIGIEILEGMKLFKSEHLLQMYEIVLNLYKFMGLTEKEQIIIDKIKSSQDISS